MSNFKRRQFDTLLERLKEFPHHLIVITGPRQCGKTTLITQVLEHVTRPCAYVATDRTSESINWYVHPNRREFKRFQIPPTIGRIETPRPASWLTGIWQQARVSADSSPNGMVLVIDEIQKVENWSETVKGLWDEDRLDNRDLHVVLLGSAPLMMQSGLSESLLGRFETVALRHWSFGEMAAAFGFDIERFVFFGGYPGGASLINDLDRWRTFVSDAIVTPTVERDILGLQQIDKPTLLNRLFEFCAVYSGRILSFNKMLGQFDDAGNTTTLSRYLELLEKVWMVRGLNRYSGSEWKQRASSPKLNVLNSALMSAYSTYSFEEARADRTHWGRMLESAVGAHLHNTKGISTRLYYWRDGDREVDFVLTSTNKVVAFEVKGSPFKSDWSGLDLFKQKYLHASLIHVGGGGVPLKEFFSKPADEWLDE